MFSVIYFVSPCFRLGNRWRRCRRCWSRTAARWGRRAARNRWNPVKMPVSNPISDALQSEKIQKKLISIPRKSFHKAIHPASHSPERQQHRRRRCRIAKFLMPFSPEDALGSSVGRDRYGQIASTTCVVPRKIATRCHRRRISSTFYIKLN